MNPSDEIRAAMKEAKLVSKPINDGGSITPILESQRQVEPNIFAVDRIIPVGGLSIRDWFAGMALQGWLASYSAEYPHPASDDQSESTAALSYSLADAMLAARTKGGQDE